MLVERFKVLLFCWFLLLIGPFKDGTVLTVKQGQQYYQAKVEAIGAKDYIHRCLLDLSIACHDLQQNEEPGIKYPPCNVKSVSINPLTQCSSPSMTTFMQPNVVSVDSHSDEPQMVCSKSI